MKPLLVLLLTVACSAQPWPNHPKPKLEPIKFGALSAAFAASAGFQIWAQHEGARQCVAEDNRSGVGNLFGKTDGAGRRPRDKTVYAIDGGILGGALTLELTGHKTAAKRLLKYAFVAQTSVAAATYWAGCN